MRKFIEFIKGIGFDVENYNSLNDFSDYDVILQLINREKMAKWASSIFSDDGMNCVDNYFGLSSELAEIIDIAIKDTPLHNLNNLTKEHKIMLLNILFYKAVFKNPLDDNLLNCRDKYFTPQEIMDMRLNKNILHEGYGKYMLPYTDSVKALSRYDLESFVFSNALHGVGAGAAVMYAQDEIEKMDAEDVEKLNSLSNESLNCVIDTNGFGVDFKHEMLLKIGLGKTDEEIIKDLTVLLPIWRQKLNIETPDRKRGWDYIRNKIISYKIIPLQDIMALAGMYTYITKKRVSKKDIAFLVYPYERDGFGLVQTVIPFLEKIKGKSSQFITDYKITK